MCSQDKELCWLLMFGLNYNDYFDIKCDNFYKVIFPTVNNNDYLDGTVNLSDLYHKYGFKIDRMRIGYNIDSLYDNSITNNYCFSKLTLNEMIEFLINNDFDYYYYLSTKPKYINISKFHIGDICNRIYVYRTYNEIIHLTQPVKDLITQSEWYDSKNFAIRVYTNNEIDDMNFDELELLADLICISNTDNIKESIRRILRMSYLLSLRD